MVSHFLGTLDSRLNSMTLAVPLVTVAVSPEVSAARNFRGTFQLFGERGGTGSPPAASSREIYLPSINSGGSGASFLNGETK